MCVLGVGMYAYLPGTVAGMGHGNPEIQGSRVEVGPITKKKKETPLPMYNTSNTTKDDQ